MTVSPETRRQEILYQDVFNIYAAAAADMTVGSDKRLSGKGAGIVSGTPMYEGQLGKYFPSSEYNAASPAMGRTLQDNMLTLDRCHFPLGVELVDGWVIELDTPDHPDRGSFFRCQGNSETWNGSSTRRSLYSRVFCKRIPPPIEILTGIVPSGTTLAPDTPYDITSRLDIEGTLDVG